MRTTSVLTTILLFMILACLFPDNAFSQTFGTITLKPTESRRISIGPTFRDLRVCNDLTSTGSVMIKVGSSFERLPLQVMVNVADQSFHRAVSAPRVLVHRGKA